MLSDNIASLSQRRRSGDAVCVGGHGACKPISVFVVMEDIKLHASDRLTIQSVGFG